MIPRPKNIQDVNDYIFGIWILKIKKVNAINVAHMPKVVFDNWLLDIHLAYKKFVNIPFHGVFLSPCSPSKNFEMWAYGT